MMINKFRAVLNANIVWESYALNGLNFLRLRPGLRP